MLGLRVHVRGCSPLTLALPQKRYVVSAGAFWRRGRPRDHAESYFHGTGIDDRMDHLKWLWIQDPARKLWMDIEVVDASVAAAPRRQPRRAINWKRFFTELRARDRKRMRMLEARLRRALSGILYRESEWTSQPPALGYRVALNGRALGRVGVQDPGTVSVTVVVKQHRGRQSAYLSIHGGDRVGQSSWRWRTWPFDNRGLKVGDRVRIEVVAPVRLSCGRVQKLETTEVADPADIAREVKELRKRVESTYYRKEADDVIQTERTRPPTRHYPRGSIREP